MKCVGKNKWLLELFLLLAGFHIIGSIRFANIGEDVKLKCPANRVNSWQYGKNAFLVLCENGKSMININLSRSDRIKESDDCTFLTLTNFTKEDTGTYSCYYQDLEDKSGFKQHAVQVKLRNIKIIEANDSEVITRNEGEYVILTCTVEGAMQDDTLCWTRECGLQNVQIIQNIHESRFSTITKFVANRSDNMKEFRCVTKNSVNTLPLTVSVRLKLILKPRITIMSSRNPAVISRGQGITLTCHDENEDIGIIDKFLWIHNTSPLPYTTKHLLIENATISIAGAYTCIAENDAGRDSDIKNISVIYPPVVQNKTVTFSAGKTPRTLECKASGVPDVYNFSTWQHYTYNYELVRSLRGNTNGTLFLHENVSTYRDGGIYECNVTNGVSNEWGQFWQTGTLIVTIEGKPEKPNDVVIGSSSKYIFLKWKSGLNGGYNQSFIIQYRKKSSSAWKYIKKENSNKRKQSLYIINLEPNTKYELRLYACNKFGNSTMTKHSISTTGEKSSENQSYRTEFLLVLVVIIPLCIGITLWRLKKAKNSSPDNSHRANDEGIQVDGGAAENNLYQAGNDLIQQPSVSSNREDDAYSSIDRRQQVVHRQNVTYQTSKRDKKDNQYQPQSSMNNGRDHQNLNYVDVAFDNTIPNGTFSIHGVDERTPYADIDFFARADPLIISEENEESLSSHSVENDDFVSLEEVQQWMISKE